MQRIKYIMKVSTDDGFDSAGPICTLPYSESNMELAKTEAYGEITVYDDGKAEEIDEYTMILDLLSDHEYRVCMLELGGDV